MNNAPPFTSAGQEIEVSFCLNGEYLTMSLAANTILADLLRNRLGLKGLNVSCASGVCGSCTVLVDNEPVSTCSMFAYSLQGKEIITIEGLGRNGEFSAVQQAFMNHSAFQCGYCTPGMILLATALLAANPNPSRDEIRSWMSANICRCTGYEMIFEAVELAAAATAGGGDG